MEKATEEEVRTRPLTTDFIVTRTPLRISFFGGRTDWPEYYEKHGGLCVGAAINRYIYVAVNPRDDRRIYINTPGKSEIWNIPYEPYPVTSTIEKVENPFIRCALMASSLHTVRTGGISIWVTSDVTSSGCGLGTSSALLVGLLRAFSYLASQNENYMAGELAKRASLIDLDLTGGGVQDCWHSVLGGINRLRFESDGQTRIKHMSEFVTEGNLLLFDTRIFRNSKAFTSQPLDWEVMYGIKTLAEKFVELHPMEQRAMFPTFLQDQWDMKRKVAKGVTDNWLDRVYFEALDAGAISGKLCGAGGGGHFLFYVLPEHQDAVKKKMDELGLKYVPFAFDFSGSQVIDAAFTLPTSREKV